MNLYYFTNSLMREMLLYHFDFVITRPCLIMVLFGIHVQLLTGASIPVKMYNVLSSNGVCVHVNAPASVFVLSVCGMGM